MPGCLLDFREDSGRLFEPSRNYKYPVDGRERERLELFHDVITLGLGDRLFVALIDPDRTSSVFDIGTSTWAIDFGDKHGNAKVGGWDISPIQPEWAPLNVRFLIQDINDVEYDWGEKFEFIHVRCMTGSIKSCFPSATGRRIKA